MTINTNSKREAQCPSDHLGREAGYLSQQGNGQPAIFLRRVQGNMEIAIRQPDALMTYTLMQLNKGGYLARHIFSSDKGDYRIFRISRD